MILSFALSYGGFAALCLSMQRHHRDLIGKAPSSIIAWSLRLAGYVLLALSIWLCVALSSASVGVVLWLGLLSAAALLLVGLMAWNLRAAAWTGVAAPLAALIFFLAGIQK